jgi:hypothetical protein
VALKSGQVIQFQNYKVEGSQLIYTDANGKEARVTLAQIDMARTRQLSAADSPPLQLPGLRPQSPPAAPRKTESLGEVAEKVRPPDAKITDQRVFTNDNVDHDTSSTAGTKASRPPRLSAFDAGIQNAQKWIDAWGDKKPREMSDAAVRDIEFPGRDEWERRLYEHTKKMVRTAQAAVDAAKDSKDASSDDERAASLSAAQQFLSQLDQQRPTYDQLVAEGVRRADDWKHH